MSLQLIHNRVRAEPKRIVFAEGEEERVIRAAIAYRNAGYGTPVLIGREELVREAMAEIGLDENEDLEIHNARLSARNKDYTEFVFKRLQREGFLVRDCQRLVNQDRNVFAACMVATGDADGMVTGLTRPFAVAFREIGRVIDPRPGERLLGVMLVVTREGSVFIADTRVHEVPEPEELADIAEQTAAYARQLGHDPRVALLSFSTFGQPKRPQMARMQRAVEILGARNVDFEFDGEMQADMALNYELMQQLYPFCRLSGPANVLIMPALHSASISAKLLQELGGGTVIGPILSGLSKPVQIVQMGATTNDLVNAATFAAHEAITFDEEPELPGV